MNENCMTCGGEGRTDGNPDVAERAPWSFWENLPAGSDLAVRFGLVKPVPCANCDGTGKVTTDPLAGIKTRLHAASPNPDVEWEVLTDPGDPKTAAAWIVDADDIEIRLPATYAAGKVAALIAEAPKDLTRLLAAVEAGLAACDTVIDNADGHKPPGPPHPTREQATAVRIRAALAAALGEEP